MEKGFRRRRELNSFQIIILGFAAVILLGAFLLMLPFSSQSGEVTPFLDCLFTSTSAVCVTGLVVYDTATHWSAFGQALILLMIQIGGMGVVTVAVFFTKLSGKKISLMQRSTVQEALSAPKVGGIVRLTNFIIKTIFILELLGAVLMAPVFYQDFGPRGIWMAFFHSISAFCNAGFDLMGSEGAFSSLVPYASHPLINLTIIFLILAGGIGFLTWEDIKVHRFHFRQYRMQTKVVLCMTAILLLIPMLYFYFFEFSALPGKERFFYSLFQAVTPRTAGFNTVNLTQMSEQGRFIMTSLMLIGGSPGSTAGGMKMTTIAVLFASAYATFFREENAHFFGRRIQDEVVKSAATIFMMYIVLCGTGGLLISIWEQLPLSQCLFESASAIGTVGLTLGLTPTLGTASRLVLILLMFCGRVGGLTLIFAALNGRPKKRSQLPQEKIIVG